MQRWSVVVVASLLAVACGSKEDARAPERAAVVAAPPRAAVVGMRAPPISLRAIDGTTLTLEKGRVTLVAFWATWSSPDKIALERLEKVYQAHKGEGFTLLAVNIDDDGAIVPEFAKTYGLHFPIAWDGGRRTTTAYEPAYDPSFYVVDRAGVIRFVHGGFHDGMDVEMESEVAELLRK